MPPIKRTRAPGTSATRVPARRRRGDGQGPAVDDYRHDEANRLNNPEAGLARYETELPPKHKYSYDPRVDPQLVWSGKSEGASFEVDAVSIHVHERLSTEAIVRTLRKESPQLQLFGDPDLDRDLEVQFYQHEVDWTNRMILGDSLVAMTSLLVRERMAGQVQCIYIDPPYGINYNSNFQPRQSSRQVKENDESLTREPEQVKAFRDTWVLGKHSYLTYLRDRLTVAAELLADSGSIFVQINDTNLHYVRVLLDEQFGADNFIAVISFKKKKMPLGETFLFTVGDFIVWYAKDRRAAAKKFRRLYLPKAEGDESFNYVELPSGERLSVTECRQRYGELPSGSRLFQSMDLRSSGRTESCVFPVEFDGRTFSPGGGRSWKTNREGIEALRVEKRLFAPKDTLRYVLYLDDYPVSELSNSWMDTQGATDPVYVVQTATKVVERCMLMCTDPGDLVLDPTCGSGTAAYVAERFGRRWIVMDTSAVALSLARERLLTATFPYFRLVDDRRGVDAGFRYQTVAHLTLGSIARDEEAEELALRDQPEVDGSKVRVSGPFTFEALSRYAINPVQDGVPPDPGDLNAAADHVEALLDALKVRGVPVKGGHDLHITRIIRLSTTSPLHAEGATDDGRTFAVSVGPRYGPITMLQVDDALDDAHGYDLVVFVGFTATAEVQSHLSKGKVGRYNVVLLEANADLLVADLLKNTSASQTFRLFAAPDVAVARHKETLVLKLRGVDVYDASSGRAVSRGHEDIAAWFLDHDYDGQVFHVCQAFFPKSESWDDLAKALKGAINEEILARLRGFESSPFQPGEHGRAAVRVIDDNGQTSEAVIDLGD